MLTWDEGKRRSNLRKHGVDFASLAAFDWAAALHREDPREAYGEVRMVSIGPLDKRLHVVVWTERAEAIRIISLRKANSRERDLYERQELHRE